MIGVRRLARAALGRVDVLLDATVGERLNPMRHLGPIAYGMFWVVVASGAWVYAFYRTGIDTSYASVEAITHDPWRIGGLMRSLHRYASDGLVLAALLHLVRQFAFDAYRGARAFSWVTGAAAFGLAYAAGVNGYMLPWDRLAQYTVTTTAEWLDALPVFGGVLVRNFISAEALTDRFFSLLSFLHIGVPLALLALLWVHTQRVPGAKTMPPRPIAATALAALVVLSLAKPALSSGAADLGSLPATLGLDWFYLAGHALVGRWPPLALWVATAAVALLAIAAPWLPPLSRSRALPWRITVEPAGSQIDERPGETLLDAALRHGVPVAYGCRHGACGLCRATLERGAVSGTIHAPIALSANDRARGEVLLCCACAASDVSLRVPEPTPGKANAAPALPPELAARMEAAASRLAESRGKRDRDDADDAGVAAATRAPDSQ